MLRKFRSASREEGFTIIEVLIVLAIAGLILLVVFLAVPALQRNSRNTQRKNDVTGMLGTLQEAINNNGGKVPTGTTAPAVVTDKLGFYVAGDVDYNGVATTTGTVVNSMDTSKVYIRNGLRCNNTIAAGTASATFNVTGITTTTNANSRSVVVLYAVEATGSNVQPQCQES